MGNGYSFVVRRIIVIRPLATHSEGGRGGYFSAAPVSYLTIDHASFFLGGVRMECTHFMHCRSGITAVVCGMTRASLQRQDGARRVFTDQADIVCTKRKAP